MTDTPAQTTIDVAALNALLQTVQQQANAPIGSNAPPANGWQQPAPAANLNFMGVGIPVSVQTPAGKVRCTFWLGAEHAATPAALMSAIETMVNLGLPVDAWQQQNQQGGGSWGGNNNGGGFKKRW
jgi:hypothetical protein